jgi:hypothetical protein
MTRSQDSLTNDFKFTPRSTTYPLNIPTSKQVRRTGLTRNGQRMGTSGGLSGLQGRATFIRYPMLNV